MSRWAAVRWPLIAFATGTLCSLLALQQLARYNAAIVDQAARKALAQAASQIEARLERYQYGLMGARGALVVAGVARIDAATFARYSRSRDYGREFPGARGFGFIRRVELAGMDAYLMRMRQARGPDFAVRQLAPHGGTRYIIELIEPAGPNRAAIGLDIASESERRRAAETAMANGMVALTGPITLVQASGRSHQSFLMLLPVYADNAPASPASVAGWVYAPLIMPEVLAHMRSVMPAGALVLDDVTAGQPPQRFYADNADALAGAVLAVEVTRNVMGRRWRCRFQPGAVFVAREQLVAPAVAAAAAAMLTVLLATAAAVAAGYRSRQARLRGTQAHLAAIVESSSDAIIGSSLDGIVKSWNRSAELIFGYPAAAAIGRPVAELIVPAGLRHEEDAILAAVRRGEAFEIVQTRRHRQDGSLLDVSMAVAPIRDGSGAVVGGSKTIRDISPLVAAQAAVSMLNASLERDVAQRTAELDTARRALRTVLDAVPAMIGYWDAGLVNRVANRGYAQFFGLDADDVPGRSMLELLGEPLYREIEPRARAALRGEPQHFERDLVLRDGSMRHSLAHYLPDVVDGVTSGFYVIVHDVSDLVASRQALASALRENDVLVRTINEQLLYSVTDASGIILEVNDNFCQALGYRREELVGADHRLLKSKEHDDNFWGAMWRSIGAGETWHGTICNRSADDQPKWFDTVVAPYFDEHGVIERYVALRTDVTARHAADAALRHLSALLSNVLRAASEMSVIATDAAGVITLFNAGAERMLGYEEAELVGRSTPACLHDPGEVAERANELSAQQGCVVQGFDTFTQVPLQAGAETREWTYVRKDGGRFPVLLTVTAMRDDTGAVLGYLGIGMDISQRKRDDAALRHSMELARQASLAKSEFVANMSHEIRTPMNAVLGMLTLARRTQLTERQRDYLDKADGAAQSLLGLLNDILDFSKIEAGKLEMELHPFALEDLLHELAVVVTGNNASKTVDVMFDIGPDVPPHLVGDPRRLLQVLINLAGNALKFTHDGNVVVRLAVLAHAPGAVTLRVSVSDTGIGIAADQLERIFDGFTQAEASTSRRFGGTGLGLAISAHLVGLMGGKLSVDSQPGRGSEFWFDLVLAPAVPPAADTSGAGLRGMSALVVDDNEVSGTILLHMVEAIGCTAEYVRSGAAAQARVAQARQSGAPFAVVLMDLRMPEVDGLQVAARMADDPLGAPPVIIVSAYAQDELRLRAGQAAPYSAVLTKPVTAGALVAALQHTRYAQSRALAPAPERPARLSGMQLLVVEDNELNRQVAFELLASEGALIDLAECGLRAVALATDLARCYDAVLMDVQMPDVDGLEATRRIRRHEPARHVPIIAMTANASTADRTACLDAGMDGHIGKPFNIDEVVALLAQLRSGSAQTPGVPMADESVAIDLEGALQRFMGDTGRYRQALDEFERDVGGKLAALAQVHGESKIAGSLLHALKGLALTIGANSLARRIAQVEEDLRAGLPGAEPAVLGEALADEASYTLSALRAALGARIPATGDATGNARPAAHMDVGQRRNAVSELLSLLESGNLRALDIATALAGQVEDEPLLHATLESIQQLQFAEAAIVLRQWCAAQKAIL